MTKIAQRYLEVDPWKLIEKGFHEDRAEVSESLFHYPTNIWESAVLTKDTRKKLVAFNGIYEVPRSKKVNTKASPTRIIMANACNFLSRIYFNANFV